MKKIIGFRALLSDKKSEADLVNQLRDFDKEFPDWKLVVASCGETLTREIKNLADDTVYYSEEPVGLTEPWKLIIKNLQPTKLLLTDGDRQHKATELKRALKYYENDFDAGIPVRKERSLAFSDSKKNRKEIEDLENSVFSNANPDYSHPDPQPGAIFILNKELIEKLNFSQCGSMAVDLVLHDQLVKLTKGEIARFKIETREQENSEVTEELEKTKMEELGRYFGTNLLQRVT